MNPPCRQRYGTHHTCRLSSSSQTPMHLSSAPVLIHGLRFQEQQASPTRSRGSSFMRSIRASFRSRPKSTDGLSTASSSSRKPSVSASTALSSEDAASLPSSSPVNLADTHIPGGSTSPPAPRPKSLWGKLRSSVSRREPMDPSAGPSVQESKASLSASSASLASGTVPRHLNGLSSVASLVRMAAASPVNDSASSVLSSSSRGAHSTSSVNGRKFLFAGNVEIDSGSRWHSRFIRLTNDAIEIYVSETARVSPCKACV
jgi:hypothetical protein